MEPNPYEQFQDPFWFLKQQPPGRGRVLRGATGEWDPASRGATGDFDTPMQAQSPFSQLAMPGGTEYSGMQTYNPNMVRQRAQSGAVRGRSLASIPTQGTGTPPPGQSNAAPEPGGGADGGPLTGKQMMQDVWRRTQQHIDESTKAPDMSGAVDAYRRRYEAAGPDIAFGMFMGEVGGDIGSQFGGQVLKNALAARQPDKGDYGTIDYQGGFTADPHKERDFKMKRNEMTLRLLEDQAKTALTTEESERNHRAQEALRRDQMRMHQENLAEQRALRRQQMEQGRFSTFKDADGNVGVINTRTGEIVGHGGGTGAGGQGGTGIPKLNDSQGKAVAFGMRAAEAARQLESLGGEYSTASVAAKGGLERVPGVGGMLGSGYNMVMGASEQQAEQAQRNFINAVLRRESGAVINPDEFSNARQQYFPQPGDSEEVLAQKKQNRDTAIRGLMIESGPGARFVQEKIGGGQQQQPQRPGLPRASAPQGDVGSRKNEYLKRAGGSGDF